MRSPTTILSSTSLFLALLPQASIVTATAARAACVHQRSTEFSEVAACGDKGSLQHCFRNSPDYVSWSLLEQCFEGAGCTSEEAGIEASFVVKQCGEGSSDAELRRRGPPPVAARTTIPLVLAARQDATTTTTDATTAATSPLTCTADSLVTTRTCPLQSTGTASGRALSCYETVLTTQVCAPDLVCSDSLDTCMERIDVVPGAGALFCVILLAVVFGGGFAALFALCCLDKRRERRLRAQKEAAAIAKEGAPLLPPPQRTPSGRGGGGGGGGGGDDDPFADANRTGM